MGDDQHLIKGSCLLKTATQNFQDYDKNW